MKSCFIVNPNAGGGRGLKLWNKACAYMKRRGYEYEIYFTTSPGDAGCIARELTDTHTDESFAVFVIGGDGTLSEVVDGLRHPEHVNVGYIPANLKYSCARSLRLKSNPGRLIRSYNSPNGSRVEAMDYGVLTGSSGETTRRFMNSAGIGFDAELCSRVSRCRSGGRVFPTGFRGSLIVYREMLKELVFSKPVRGYIILDGTQRIEFNNLMFVSAHIHPFEFSFKFGGYADPKDGMLEICAVSCRSKLRMLMLMLKSRFGMLRGSGKVRLLQCREAHVHFDRECVVHADGEPLGLQTDIDLRCISQQLHMIR